MLALWLLLAVDELAVREYVYQAEVHGRVTQSEMGLTAMLAEAEQPEERHHVVRALAVVKAVRATPVAAVREARLWRALQRPEAILHHRHMTYLLVDRRWLALGDWIDDYFFLEISNGAVVLEHRDGLRREQPLDLGEVAADALLDDADVRDLVTFVAQRMGLNSFAPSAFERSLSGRHVIEDWLTFLDVVCREAGVTWTRRRDNIIFTADMPVSDAERVGRLEQKNLGLTAFLEDLAVTFDMELEISGDLSAIEVDIHLQDQPWDEILDCLSILNDFAWVLIREEDLERPRLIIQKE